MAFLVLSALLLQAAPTQEPTAADLKRAKSAFATAKKLFQNGQQEQAYVEFKTVYELTGMAEALLNMAQCQYHVGRLKEARALYQRYLDSPDREADAEVFAHDRIAAIDNRRSTLSINTVPEAVDVKILDEAGKVVETGQAPNRFEVRHGRYKIVLSKPAYVTQTRQVDVEIADAQPLFFQLQPVPARLEITTRPAGATLYVRGNRARNPYVQSVEPGEYELYAEAKDYEDARDVLRVSAGDSLKFELQLKYVQRSGRPELIGFWTAAGAVAGVGGVLAQIPPASADDVSSATASAAVVAAGGIVGGVVGGLVATAVSPPYIRDNLAMFRIGAAWVGATEGAMVALTIRHTAGAAWLGGAAGLGAGAFAGTLFDEHAPNYGRVVLIQSAAAFGVMASLLAEPAFAADLGLEPKTYRPHFVLVGLNLGVGAGLALAYLPDQRAYGPTWKRVVLVDLAGAAGAFAGALAGTLSDCRPGSTSKCEFKSTSRTAKLALIGTGVGLVSGWALTRGYDKVDLPPERRVAGAFLPVPTAMPIERVDGGLTIVPGLAAQGRF